MRFLAMHNLGLVHNKPPRKCVRTIGETHAKYHPHGETAIYDALLRMAESFSYWYPLIQGQGNFGSMDGQPAAAQRYTEARMQKITEEMLKDIEKETVVMKKVRWRLLPFSKNRASINMAIDEAIFRLYDQTRMNTIRLYGWKPSAVSIGKNQHISEEVDIDTLNKLGFDCVRRISGGGAVFHDELGELTYSIVTNVNNFSVNNVEGVYYAILRLIFQPLEKLGLFLDYGQIHCPSVFSRGKKISGNAQARDKDVILQHGTILVQIRPEIMYSVLKARPGRTRESMIESVYQHVTTINETLEKNVDLQSIADYLSKAFLKTGHPQSAFGKLTEEERDLSIELTSNKYESEAYIHSK